MSSNNWRLPLSLTLDKEKIARLLAFSRSQNWFYGLVLFSLFIVLMYLIQFSTDNLVGTDGYYHIKFASLMRLEGLKPGFPWLPLTILNPGEFADHHFLFHILLIPFTIGDLIVGAKLATVLFASLAFLSIWWLLRNQNVAYAGLCALGLLAISEAFLYRMNMPRAQSLSLAVLALGLNFMLVRKYIFLIPLGFFYVWMYDAFPLLVVLALVYVISVWMIERKIVLQPLYFVLAGVTLGMIINPYFPNNIIFFIRHILPKLVETGAVRVGNEWYPYETGQLLENSPLALLVFLSGVTALGLRNQRMNTPTATALFMAIFFAIMLFQSRRFIEYFPPFALIFAALAWEPLISAARRSRFVPSGERDIPGTTIPNAQKMSSNRTWLGGTILAVFVFFGIWFTTRNAQQSVMDSKPAQRYSGASAWLMENTPSGARVFQTDWDDFPHLFFYNTRNTYLIGLDPTYLHLKDPDLFELWVDITQGREQFPSKPIFRQFAAEYVFTDTSHKKFIDRAREDLGLEEVYQDDEALIFQVIDKGDQLD
jgi:hypothetical protein